MLPAHIGFILIFAQISFGTTNFTSALYVNGDLRIRNTNVTVTPTAPKYSIFTVKIREVITFKIISDLSNIKLLGTIENCFFTVQQIR